MGISHITWVFQFVQTAVPGLYSRIYMDDRSFCLKNHLRPLLLESRLGRVGVPPLASRKAVGKRRSLLHKPRVVRIWLKTLTLVLSLLNFTSWAARLRLLFGKKARLNSNELQLPKSLCSFFLTCVGHMSVFGRLFKAMQCPRSATVGWLDFLLRPLHGLCGRQCAEDKGFISMQTSSCGPSFGVVMVTWIFCLVPP